MRFVVKLLTIPAVRCTNQTPVEIRAGFENKENDPVSVGLDFFIVDSEGKTVNRIISGDKKVVAAGQKELFSAWFSTENLCGDYTIQPIILKEDGDEFIPVNREIKIIDCPTKALPVFDVAWMEPGYYVYGKDGMKSEAEDVEMFLELLSRSGIHSLVITYTEEIYQKIGTFYPTDVDEIKIYPSPVDYDLVGTVMKKAEELSMNVFMGLGRGDDLTLTWDGFGDKSRFDKQIDFSIRLADDLYRKYSRYNSFYGWYLAHEADDIQRANAYYNPVSEHLHALSPEKAVMIAPSGTPIVTAQILKECDCDIVAYQDAVGSGYVPGKNTWESENRIKMLPDCYKRYNQAHMGTQKHIWTDLEIWKMDGPAYGNAYAAEYKQIVRQIEIERPFVESISAYSMPLAYEDANARFKYMNNKGAAELCNEYLAYYDKLKSIYKL